MHLWLICCGLLSSSSQTDKLHLVCDINILIKYETGKKSDKYAYTNIPNFHRVKTKRFKIKRSGTWHSLLWTQGGQHKFIVLIIWSANLSLSDSWKYLGLCLSYCMTFESCKCILKFIWDESLLLSIKTSRKWLFTTILFIVLIF